MTSDNNEDYPWPKATICIAGNYIFSGLQPSLLSQKHKVNVKSCSGANSRDTHNNIIPILQHKPEHIILHIHTTNAQNFPPNEILDKILELSIKIKKIKNYCKVIISMQIHHFDSQKAANTVSELTHALINLNNKQ